jgi:chromosome partitioning protein
MSKIILVASQKGGVGKSTVITNIAAALALSGVVPYLVDADEQPTSSEWGAGRIRDYPDSPSIIFSQDYGEIDWLLESLDNDIILVDSAGHASVEMRSAMSVCDILLCPFKASQADLNTIPYMSEVVKQAKWINPKLKALAFINQAPTNPAMNSIAQAKALIAEYSEFMLLDTVIYHRDVYLSAMSIGLGVVEMAGKSASEVKAKNEITALTQEILKWLN